MKINVGDDVVVKAIANEVDEGYRTVRAKIGQHRPWWVDNATVVDLSRSLKVGDVVHLKAKVQQIGADFYTVTVWGDDEEFVIPPSDIVGMDTAVIYDPDAEEAKALIGKNVLFSDYYKALKDGDAEADHVYEGILGNILDDSNQYRFEMRSGSPYAFIKALPEEETQEVTMEEVCAKFGKNVKIKKGE